MTSASAVMSIVVVFLLYAVYQWMHTEPDDDEYEEWWEEQWEEWWEEE